MNRSRAIAIADRAATLSLRLIAALNLLFLVTFLFLIAFAATRARAEVPSCKGGDMLASLAASDPALLEAIAGEAAATPNGKGLLWKLEKAGEAPSFLFGTMHMTDPRVTRLPPAAKAAFEAADTVVIETTDILDEARMVATLAARPDLMMFTDGATLASLMSPEDAAAVEAGLGRRGIAMSAVAKMKPWMLSAMVALPACELARKAGGAPVLDVWLGKQAKARGKSLEGLETALDQLDAMASLPMDFHIQGLVETLKLGDRIDDVIETMIVLYKREDTGMFWPLFRAVLPEPDDAGVGYAAFEEAMVTARNRTMAANAAPILKRGNAFIAVGALHLPGDKGLIELFRGDGYTVKAVN